MAFNQSERGGKSQKKAQKKNKMRRLMLGSDKTRCRFTRSGLERVDYKDTATLTKLVTAQGKIYSRKRAGNRAIWQRKVKLAIKRARFMSLMPYVAS